MTSSMLDVITSTNNKFTLKSSRTGLRSFVESPDEKRYSKKQPYQINVDKLLNLKSWTLSPTALNFYLLDILHYQNKQILKDILHYRNKTNQITPFQ